MSATIETAHGSPAPVAVRPLADAVPTDVMRIVRLCAMAAYVIGLMLWSYYRGMIWQRLAVAAALGIFLVCAYIGRPWRTWLHLLTRDVPFYCAMWYAYEMTRGVADEGIAGVKFPLQMNAVRNIDRVLFFGNDPNVVLQDHFWKSSVQWWDKVASTVYFTHFIVPPIVMGALWATSRYQWWRFMKRFATVIVVACAMFVVLPTAPPWMAADKGAIGPIIRKSGRGFSAMGFEAYTNDWQISKTWGNAVAAMPSLHSAFALFVPAFFLPWIRPRWLKALVMLFPLTMLTSLVYLGEHWVVDGLVGFALVGGSFWFWNWFEDRQRIRRADAALAATAGSA